MDLVEATLLSLLERVRSVSPGRERRALIREAAAQLGRSERTVYRRLKALGLESGRKKRADAGTSSVQAEQLETSAARMARARNKRGQPNMPMKETWRLARERGEVDCSYRQFARRLNQEGLGLRHLCAPDASVARVSCHPNHVWQIDVSIGIQWFFRDPVNGKRLDLYDDAGARFYEGKRHNLATIRRVIHRYLIVDHYTGAFCVQYFYSAGENAEDAVQSLWAAVRQKPSEVAQAYPFRGLPTRLVTDQGSAFKSALFTELLKALNIVHELHAPKNAKASGSVEKTHDHWQRSFEGRLAARPAQDLDELNRWALHFSALANAEREHSRHGSTRMGLWSTIRPEQLREPPDRETFFRLATSRPDSGVLDNYLRLRSGGRTWQVTGEGVHPRQRVSYRLSPFLDVGIRVWDEHERELVATELTFDEAGFPEQGLRHVWDDEEAKGATAPKTPAQAVAQAAAEEEEPVRLGDLFDDLGDRLERYAYLTRQGQAFEATAPAAAEPRLSSLEAREEVARRLGRALGEDAAWWREALRDGATATELDALFETFHRRGRKAASQE